MHTIVYLPAPSSALARHDISTSGVLLITCNPSHEIDLWWRPLKYAELRAYDRGSGDTSEGWTKPLNTSHGLTLKSPRSQMWILSITASSEPPVFLL